MGRSNFMLQFMLDTSPYQIVKNSRSKWLTSWSPLLIPPLLLNQLFGVAIQPTLSKTLPLLDYLEIISTVQCSYKEHGTLTQRQSAALTRRVVAQMKQQHVISPNETVSCTCTNVRAYKDGYSDNTLLDILRGCKKYNVTKLLIETNFGDGIVGELFKKHLQQTKQAIDVEEVRANVRKEDRIIDSLEPVLNQHRLVIDRSVIDNDFKSNPDRPPEERLQYMLFYQMSRMCREKGAIRHDDRLDCLAQGVKYYTDALAISARQQMILDRREDWKT